ncbi:hypothetical protein HN587_05125 [Candidatus Woesearchaeota archaeon]|jgi:hypothetical protein|nr:hypothetical protein [Candidatus Woesearchaeota archaeon]
MLFDQKLKNKCLNSKVWSNIFFIIPLTIAIWNHLILHSILLAGVIIFSCLYHAHKEKKFELIDKILAYSLIFYNLYLCYLSNFKQPYFLLALVFVFIGIYYLRKKKKDDWEWHLSSAIITLLCILAYVVAV